MTTETLKELVTLSREGACAIELDVASTGIMAHVSAFRAGVCKNTEVWLDINDPQMADKLEEAVKRIQ